MVKKKGKKRNLFLLSLKYSLLFNVPLLYYLSLVLRYPFFFDFVQLKKDHKFLFPSTFLYPNHMPSQSFFSFLLFLSLVFYPSFFSIDLFLEEKCFYQKKKKKKTIFFSTTFLHLLMIPCVVNSCCVYVLQCSLKVETIVLLLKSQGGCCAP